MIKTILLATRPPFLLLSLSVVVLGTAIALYQGAIWSSSLFMLVLLTAVLAHAAVNLLNEYQDFQSGLDAMTDKTPFSGGSGALPNHPQAAPYVLNAFLVVMGALIVLGGYLIFLTGWSLLPLGIIGLLLILFYTQTITRFPWLCLIAPGIAFGPIMIVGIDLVWSNSFSWLALSLSLVPFFWVNNLLLLSQIPDLTADKRIGRFNILMKHGVHMGTRIFMVFALLAYVSLAMSMVIFQLPSAVLLAFSGMLLLIPMLNGLLKYTENSEKLPSILGMNVIINIITPLLIALGLLWSSIQ
ncbi:MAG: prenyltransferase [Thiomicrorhabdus sp.]|nr:prenyltransferase [Thiomicrorhabdus sp.]